MRRLLAFSILGFVAWLALATGWAVAAHLTPMPGPARTASGSMDVTARALEAVNVPRPLAAPRDRLTNRIRSTGQTFARLYSVPERLAGRLVHRLPAQLHTRGLFGRNEVCLAPVAQASDRHVRVHLNLRQQELHRRLAELQRRLESRRALSRRQRIRAEELRERLQRLIGAADADGIVIRIVR